VICYLKLVSVSILPRKNLIDERVPKQEIMGQDEEGKKM
jgi:hypothetical protein